MISRFNTGFEYDFDDLPELIINELMIIDELNDQPAIFENTVWALIIDKWYFDKWEMCLKRNTAGNWRVYYCNYEPDFE